MKKLAFLDLETTSLDERQGDLWEIGLIMRDLQKPAERDAEWWWQVRPDLSLADANSVQVGRYYERCRITFKDVGGGRRLAPTTLVDGSPWLKEYTGKPLAEGDFYMNDDAKGIARTIAPMLDGVTIVANNPAFDRRFLTKFLRVNGQLLTAHYRMINVRDLLIGYIEGCLSMLRDVEEAFGPEIAPYVLDWLNGAADSPAWEIVGVKQDPATRHTALGDARLVRDVYDAIRGGR
ncbi:hypothetical protein [Nonomuraea basaltis]|uniref:hypothetical protein n=1 Tax=Nonomuraea basaltis TaxID=2495887 RepID=UPI00110C6A25|nr:hypothetical protein [Nonomuraea basaltis]TMR92835.1 hypothetical protein EJK15_42535 [Nonomuraea basaltis]